MLKRSIFLLILLLPAVLVFSEADETKTLTVCYSATDYQWDPIHSYTSIEAQLYTAIYEGLVTYHPFTLEPVPGLARFWEVLPDGKTYRFYLRENARYWNGDRVTAEHFRGAWLALLDPEEKAEYSSLFDIVKGAYEYRTGQTDDRESVAIRVVSEDIIEIELTEPAEHFLKILCHHSFSPIHPKFLKQRRWKGKTAVLSNGPFYVTSYSEDEIILAKNRLYWDAASVELDKIHIIFTHDPVEAAERFNNGEIDWGGGGIDWGSIENPNSLVLNPMFATSYLFFSCSEPPFDDPDVRRGLALLIPWEQIRTEEYMLIPSSSLVPAVPGYPEVQGIVSRNIQEGLTLLDATGFGRGENTPKLTIRIPEGGDFQRIAGIIRDSWQEHLECPVEIITHSYPGYFNILKTRPYTLGTITWIGDFADPLTFLQMWTSTSNLNDPGYRNENYDTLIRESMSQSGGERYETLRVAEELLLSEAAVLPLSHYPALNAIDIDIIDGWFPNPLDIHPFKYMRFIEPEIPPSVVMAPGSFD